MPRDKKKVRHRLQAAALELFRARGYDQTTSAAIAEAAGVTERTFFRHFPDKREVLFGGEARLGEILTKAVHDAPPGLGLWALLLCAFGAAKDLHVENRQFAEPRRQIIASNQPLQERELGKVMSLTAKLASALRERGVTGRAASLAAQVGMVAFGHAVGSWLDGDPGDFDVHLAEAFREVHDLSSFE